MGVRLTATATVKTKIGEAEITPEAVDFAEIGDAIEAAADWAKGNFSPVIGTFKKLEITIDAT